MRHIEVKCPSGTHEFCYSISTPTCTSATSVDPERPTVLFIHAGYIPQEVFQTQYEDPELRQFNLVAVDNLGHGSTRGLIGDQRYTPTETAQDLKCVMDALGLPPCHVFGLSLGATIGLELASQYPSSVLSLTLCSPVTPEELEDVIAGRIQVFNYWSEVFHDFDHGEEQRQQQEELVSETLYGAMQLLFNNRETRLTKPMATSAMVRSIDIWSGNAERIKKSYDACVRWFTERKPIPSSQLAQIRCPVNVIYASEDVGYPLENAQALVEELKGVGVQPVTFHTLHGPHYVGVIDPEGVNAILKDTVLSVSQFDPDSLPKPVPEFPGRMRTPWTDNLKRFGYDPSAEDVDADDSDEHEVDERFNIKSSPLPWFSYEPVVPEQRIF
ncbi:hypothetical protein CC1G_05534 [Coprinopsis cinerea okayama7|uniref:AB hydrolase-1 domain-containing protein n=1 Tax=Coprinopsis cinerea (strain Okayama-7 / 130 / ATCC MYA-4618 / FGSC 9003) TaxID=240176 RepID=A8P5M8_COPC7|nr:hypothetical protein CC1G_05534 [Coprinopsis cinerea okayama7\|eukprot:XP_001838981.1 hypothetical protein CC1G_05534 [Coprinopsis cinerea okayama7\